MRKVILLLLLLLPSTSYAQVGKMQYPFRSRSEVVSVLKQTRGDLRKTYNALICAARLGYTNTSLGYYETVIAGHEFDSRAQDSAAYAFAFDLAFALVRPWNWKQDKNQGLVKFSSRAGAMLYRDRALTLLPNSPEVLVMRSLFQTSTGNPNLARQAYVTTSRAVKLAPQWADAYYWQAGAAHAAESTYFDDIRPVVKNQRSKAAVVRLGKAEMRAYDMAEKLDPTLKPYLYLYRVLACESIADKECARMIPIYIDAHLRAFPEYMAWYSKQTGHSEAEFRASNQRSADEIMKNAKS